MRCWAEEVRSRQMKFGYEVVDTQTGAVLADAYTKLIYLDEQGQVTTIPEKWRSFLSQGMSDSL